MPETKKTLIMKFGGASLKSPESFSRLADLIIERKKEFPKIAVVVSAMGGMTDHLISLALSVNPAPPRREYDMLVSTGERISISLLAMALAAKGVEGVSFTGSQSGIITTEEHAQARIVAIKPDRLLSPLEKGKIVIVAGFQGVTLRSKEITTLGRGGSDTTAVALGVGLAAAKVEFYKDVRGIFEKNPIHVPHAQLYPHLNFEEALRIVTATGGKVLHPRAILLAQKNSLPLHVRSFLELEGEGTLISSDTLKPQSALYEE